MQKLAHVVVDAIMILWGAYIFLALVTFILFYGCVENGNGAAACKDNLLTEIVLFWQ